MIILGLSLGQDASVAVIRDGKILCHILRERHSGYRNHYGLDYKTIERALKESSLSIEDIDYCAVTSTQHLPALINNKSLFSLQDCSDLDSFPFILDRINATSALKNKKADNFFNECKKIRKLPKPIHKDWELIFYASPVYGPKAWHTPFKFKHIPFKLNQFLNDGALKAVLYHSIEVEIKGHKISSFFIFHHLAHAASSYYSSSFDLSLIFTHDNGIGLESGFMFIGNKNSIFPIGPHYLECGKFYEYVAHECGFDALGGHGKLMSLSSYGRGILDNLLPMGTICDWLAWEKKAFSTTYNNNAPYASMLNILLSEGNKKDLNCVSFGNKAAIFSNITKEIAFATQKHTEKTILATIQSAKETLQAQQLGSSNLCFSGEIALNCSLNSNLWSSNLFKQLHIEPQCEDGGISIGAAQFVYYHIFNQKKRTIKKTNILNSQDAMLGITYSHEKVEKAIQKFEKYIIVEQTSNWIERAVTDIAKNFIIGIFQGKSETGPRALGNRSILAHPGYKENWERVNIFKGREKWCPFASIILEEELFDWFELGPNISPFLHFTYKIKDNKKNLIPAIIHVDQTSRVQTVNQKDGHLYPLLKNLRKVCGIPLVMKTSFNGPGQPIIEYPESAIEFLLNSTLSALYIHKYRIIIKN